MKLKASVIAAFALALSIYSAALLYEGFIKKPYSGLLTYPFVDRSAAERTWSELPSDAPTGPRESAAQRLIRGSPSDPQSWMTASYVDWLEHGRRLTPAGVTALDHSYALSYFDRTAAVWRVGFALDNWTDLNPPLRRQVGDEADTALCDPALRQSMRERLRAVRNPAGRLAAFLFLSRRPG